MVKDREKKKEDEQTSRRNDVMSIMPCKSMNCAKPKEYSQ